MESKFDRFKFSSFLSSILVLSQLVGFHNVGAQEISDLTRLRTDLKNGYDPYSRPVQNHVNRTVVQMSMILRGFEFDERRSLFTLYAWIVMGWNDDHMKWDPARYSNITEVRFAAHEVWQPDVTVYNNYDSDIDHFQNTRVVASSNGRLVWVPPAILRVGCSANLRRWPYDSQRCFVLLGSWAHGGDELDIVLPQNYSRVNSWAFVENREWKLTSNYIRRREHYYECCPNSPFVDIVLTLNLERRPLTHTAAVVVPAMAIAAAILIAFWIPPRATERLALILFVIIINATYLYNVYTMIPNNGDEVPLVLLYYRDSLLMVSVALVWTICLRYLAATKRTSPVPLPGFIQGFLESWVSKLLCLDPRPATTSSSDDETGAPNDEGNLVSKSNPYQADWAWLAHLLDRVAFAIYLVVYIIFTAALL